MSTVDNDRGKYVYRGPHGTDRPRAEYSAHAPMAWQPFATLGEARIEHDVPIETALEFVAVEPFDVPEPRPPRRVTGCIFCHRPCTPPPEIFDLKIYECWTCVGVDARDERRHAMEVLRYRRRGDVDYTGEWETTSHEILEDRAELEG